MGIEEHIRAKFKDDHHKAIVNLRFTANWIGSYYNQQLGSFHLTLPQFNILRILRGAGEPLSVQMVKDRMLEPSPNTTRLIDKLLDKNFVERSRCKTDRRIIFLNITAAGLKTLEEVDKVFDDMSLKTKITTEEAIMLNTILNKLRGED
jgi:DNA-binding MarR family transcriptional regulator